MAPHIVHICTTFNGQSGGIDRLFRRLVAYRRAGYRISLVVGRDYSPLPDWDLSGIHIYQIGSLVKYIDVIKDLKALLGLIRIIHRTRPDMVHTHLAKAGTLGRWAAWICRTPVVVHTVHGPTFPETLSLLRRAGYRWIERITGEVTDYFVFVGSEVRQSYIRAGVCREANSFVVRTGRPDRELRSIQSADPSAFAELRSSFLNNGHRFLVTCVGRVVPSKQQDHAIRVLHALREQNIDAGLLIVGEGFLMEEKGYMDQLRSMVGTLGLESHIVFTGHREDVLQIMVATDAVLHTSKYEGLPNIPVEAALAAKPIVCYEVSGAREVIRDSETGFIVGQGNVRAAAERLQRLAESPELANSMGRRARRIVNDEYSESRMIENSLKLYRRILGSKP